jgi:8-oxo-dGTP pyrophosphatase MutT (NUDIX family)
VSDHHDEIRYVAAGGVVVDGDRVLVLRRPSRREVRLPKGHVDEGETLERAALREVAEESGYTDLEIVADLGSQIVGFERDGKQHERTERYFLMQPSERGLQDVGAEPQFRPMWLGWSDALRMLTFEAEREWLRRARKYLRRPPDDLPDPETVIARAEEAFRADVERPPPVTLRGGGDVDSYDSPAPYDETVDRVTDGYIDTYAFFALPHLDPDSWRHHLPALFAYALRRMHQPGDLAIEGLLWSLRPPDRDPPRLGSLSAEQEAVVCAVLDVLAFDHRSEYTELATQVLEEYWVPNALYRARRVED